LAAIDEARPKIWTELLQSLQHIVAVLQTSEEHDTIHRMADFASLAMNIGPVLGIPLEEVNQLLEGMNSEKADFTLENNPLYPLLVTWLESKGMGEREYIDSKTLFDEMEQLLPIKSKHPCKNAASFSRALKDLKTELTGWIEVTGPEKIPGGNNKTFWQIHPGSKLVLTPKEKQEDQSWR
jgi:hypothetical protein